MVNFRLVADSQDISGLAVRMNATFHLMSSSILLEGYPLAQADLQGTLQLKLYITIYYKLKSVIQKEIRKHFEYVM